MPMEAARSNGDEKRELAPGSSSREAEHSVWIIRNPDDFSHIIPALDMFYMLISILLTWVYSFQYLSNYTPIVQYI